MKELLFAFYLITISMTAQQTGTEKIIFASFRDSTSYDPSLYYMDIDGSNITRINDTIIGHSPRVSHDGKRIAYAGWDPLRSTINTNIHVLDLETNEDKIVSLFKQNDGSYLISGNECVSPTWSPDDSLIVYTDFGHWTPAAIYKVKSDTTSGFERTLLTHHRYGEWVFDWSPVNGNILYGTRFYEDSLYNFSNYFIMDLDGNNRNRLTDFEHLMAFGKYSNDSKKIAFTLLIEGQKDIYTMSHTGIDLERITNLGIESVSSISLSWSPDDSKIVFNSREQIYVVDVETKEITQLTNDNYKNYTPEWVTFFPTSAEESKENKLKDFKLYQNYPNPFNPSTTIKYSIPEQTTHWVASTSIVLKVYDILGRKVSTLVNQEQKVGNYEVQFEANGLTSGIYFYKLSINGNIKTKSMVLLR